jgi:hypothetical protein
MNGSFAIQENVQEIGEEVVIDSQGVMNEVGTKAKEASNIQPLLESQTNFDARKKTTKVQKVLVERVKDSLARLQLEGRANRAIEIIIIEPPCDLVE